MKAFKHIPGFKKSSKPKPKNHLANRQSVRGDEINRTIKGERPSGEVIPDMKLPMSDLMVATIKAKKGKTRKGLGAQPSGAAAPQTGGGGGGGRKKPIQSVIFQKPEQLNVIVAAEAAPLSEERKVIYEHAARCVLLPCMSEEAPSNLDIWNKLKKAFSILEREHAELVRKAIENNKFILGELESRRKCLGSNAIYKVENFESEMKFEAWRRKQGETITALQNKWLQPSPNSSSRVGFTGKLKVKLFNGRDLPIKDAKSSDPYVTLRVVKGKKVKSKVIQKTLNPTWNEEFILPVTEEDHRNKGYLKLVVFDHDNLTTDDFMGQVKIPLSSLSDRQPFEAWYNLHAKHDHQTSASSSKLVQGELHLWLHYSYQEVLPINAIPQQSLEETMKTASANHLKAYRELLSSLWLADNMNVPTKIPCLPLSDTSKWILDEYATRYGIGAATQQISFMQMLLDRKFWRQKVGFLELFNDSLRSVLGIIHGLQDQMSKQESLDWKGILTITRHYTEALLQKYPIAFPTGEIWEQGCLSLVVRIFNYIFKPTSTDPKADPTTTLVGYVKGALDFYYQLLKLEIQNKSAKNDNSGEEDDDILILVKLLKPAANILPPNNLNDLIEVHEAYYKDEFPPSFDIVNIAAEHLHGLVIADIQVVISDPTSVTLIHPLRVFYTTIRQFAKKMGSKLVPTPEELFGPLITQYYIQSKFPTEFKKWAKTAVELDMKNDWKPIAPDGPEPILHTSSVTNVINISLEELEFVFQWNLDLEKTIPAIIRVLKHVLLYYTMKVKKRFIKELTSPTPKVDAKLQADVQNLYQSVANHAKVKDQRPRDIFLSATTTLCVQLNNIIAVKKEVALLSKGVITRMGEAHRNLVVNCFHSITEGIAAVFGQMVDALIAKMNKPILACLLLLLEDPPSTKTAVEQRLDPFFTLLNYEFGVLYNDLYGNGWKAVILQCWKTLMKNIETFVFPTAAWTEPVPDRSPQANILLETFPSFMHFFMADGEGLNVAEMKEVSSTLSSKRLELFELPTLDLLTLAKKNEVALQQLQTVQLQACLDLHFMLNVLASRTSTDIEIADYLNPKLRPASIESLRIKFKLTNDETILSVWWCRTVEGYFGKLYLTTNHLCFETIGIEEQSSVNLTKLVTLKEDFHCGIDAAITVMDSADSKNITFWSFVRRDDVFLGICNQVEQMKKNPSAMTPSATFPISDSEFRPFKSIFNSQALLVEDPQEKQDRRLRSLFDVPSTESVRKTFRCVLITRPNSVSGELFVSTNHLCFWSNQDNRKETLPFNSLLAINKKNRLFAPVGVEIIKKDGTSLILEGFENAEAVFDYLLQTTNVQTQSRGKRILAKISANRPKITNSLGSLYKDF